MQVLPVLRLIDTGIRLMFLCPYIQSLVNLHKYKLHKLSFALYNNIIQLTAKKWNDAILTMRQKKQYKQMVIYVEACESGSMFDDLLPKDIDGERSS